MNITGFKQVTYNQLQAIIMKEKSPEVSDAQIAVALGVKTTQTVKNAFQKDEQKVSDELLTSLISIIGITGIVVWEKGRKSYFVKTK